MAGIVVITYNSADVIENCLRACLRIPDAHILVVDNASSDGTADRVRAMGVALIANESNRGFGAAANQGLAALRDDAVLILNPDAEPAGGIDALEEAVRLPGVGAAGGMLLDQAGVPQHGFNVRAFPTAWTLAFEMLGFNRLMPWNPVNRRYRVRVDAADPVPVEQPAGAFLMLRRAAWEAIGGFDEGFFPIWFEDVDYCKRLQDAGFRCLYVPAATARHYGGHSALALAWSSRQIIWYGSLLRYASKHYSRRAQVSLSILLALACIPRAVLGVIVTKSFRKALRVYIEIVRLAVDHLRKGERRSHLPAAGAAVGKTSVRL